MYTGEILKIGETHSEERVNLGRKNLNLEDVDIICIAHFGYICQFYTLPAVCMQFNKMFNSIEEAMEALLIELNKPQE